MQYCMNRQGDFVHFPEETFRKQMSTKIGRIEAELLKIGHTAYYFSLRDTDDLNKLSGAELDFLEYLGWGNNGRQ